MKSTWPIVVGLFVITVAAFWYDARNEAIAAGRPEPAQQVAAAATNVR